MEDYIFLIIAVVISIFAALKKNKNKQEVPGTEETERPRNFLMDQLLGDDFLDEPDEDEVLPEKIIRPVMYKEPLVVKSQLKAPGNFRPGLKSTIPFQSKNNFQTKESNTNFDEVDEEYDSENSSSILEDFSLRKAFVYSEIMNPKYLSEF